MSSHVVPLSIPAALTTLQQQVVLALAEGRTISAAATAAGFDRAIIYQWLSGLPEFADAVRLARGNYSLALRDSLMDLGAQALDCLRSLLANAQTPAAVRMRAALAVLQPPRDGWRLPRRTRAHDEQERRTDLLLLEIDSHGKFDPPNRARPKNRR